MNDWGQNVEVFIDWDYLILCMIKLLIKMMYIGQDRRTFVRVGVVLIWVFQYARSCATTHLILSYSTSFQKEYDTTGIAIGILTFQHQYSALLHTLGDSYRIIALGLLSYSIY